MYCTKSFNTLKQNLDRSALSKSVSLCIFWVLNSVSVDLVLGHSSLISCVIRPSSLHSSALLFLWCWMGVVRPFYSAVVAPHCSHHLERVTFEEEGDRFSRQIDG